MNFPQTVVDQRDIREIIAAGPNTLIDQVSSSAIDIDILDGSPPCSEYSVAGKGIGDQSVMRRYSDVAQKGVAALPFDYAQIATSMQPKIVILENVPALRTRYPNILGNLADKLRWPNGRNGPRAYYVNWSVLTATDFGVPQKRKRLFVVAVRRDVAEAIGIGNDDAIIALFPRPTHSVVTIKAALTTLTQSEADFAPWRNATVHAGLYRDISRLPRRPKKHTRLSNVCPGDYSRFTLTRCSLDLPAPTLVVTGQKPNGLTGAIHPEFDRKFTIPELKRLFGLPDDFRLTGTLSQAAERICRMVPPFVTKAVAESVYQNVLLPYSKVRK